MTLPRILVIDDQLAALDYRRAELCEKCNLIEVRLADSDADVRKKPQSEKAIAAVTFVSGQVHRGKLIENSVEVAKQAVNAGWPNKNGWAWALILLDLQFDSIPTQSGDSRFGIKILGELVRDWPDRDAPIGNSELPVVMLSTAVRLEGEGPSNRAGARAYVEKNDLTHGPKPQEKLRELLDEHGLIPDEAGLLRGQSFSFLKLLREARRIAQMNSGNAMLLGPTGSGKTDLALYIHRQSRRKDQPFRKYIIRASAENTEQVSLFGYWDGAFTGAEKSRAGEAELAHKGVLFLDEVHSLTSSMKLQNELLTFARPNRVGLREVKRLSSPTKPKHKIHKANDNVIGDIDENDNILVDVLLLSASDEALEDQAWRRANKFREALYRRLATDSLDRPLRVPSLAERMEDVPVLFQQFLDEKTNEKDWRTSSERTKSVECEVFERLLSYSWPGNIAQLRSVAHTVAYHSRGFGEVILRHLPALDETVKREYPDEFHKPSKSVANLEEIERIKLEEVERIFDNVEVPRSLRALEGRLPSLQKGYGKLVRNILEVAFEENSSITPTLRRLFPGEIIKDTTAAYDKLLTLSDLFMADHPPRTGSFLEDAIKKAEWNRRKKSKKANSKNSQE
jgi:DNA-binding NtrC family response regulator